MNTLLKNIFRAIVIFIVFVFLISTVLPFDRPASSKIFIKSSFEKVYAALYRLDIRTKWDPFNSKKYNLSPVLEGKPWELEAKILWKNNNLQIDYIQTLSNIYENQIEIFQNKNSHEQVVLKYTISSITSEVQKVELNYHIHAPIPFNFLNYFLDQSSTKSRAENNLKALLSFSN